VFEAVFDCSKIKETNILNDVSCKICLSNDEDSENPLINLCKCSGSLLFVHFYCLKKWMSVKMSYKENNQKTVSSYNMKSFNCEICKTPYPVRIKFLDKFFDLIEAPKPQENYIVLESLNQVKDNNNYKSIHVITLKEDEKIILGRGHDSDVRINDISVSRTHSCLKLSKGKIYLTDFKSKFGTLVLLQKQVQVTSTKLFLQIGRTITELETVSCDKGNKNKVEKLSDIVKEEKGSNSANDMFMNGIEKQNTCNFKDFDDLDDFSLKPKETVSNKCMPSSNENAKTRKNRHSSK